MKIGIVGLGTIGIKLVEYLAEKGFDVVAFNWRNIEEKERIYRANLDKKVKYEKIGLNALEPMLSRVKFAGDLTELAEVELIIDSSAEEYAIKKAIYASIAALGRGHIIATTTSSLSLERLSEYYSPEKLVGLHFFNPPTKMKLVELAFLPTNSPEAQKTVYRMLQKLDDKKIIELPPIQGYIVNRLLFLYMNAAFCLMDQYGLDCVTVDDAMKAGTNMPMGPCELSDYVGNDITLDILKQFYEAFDEEPYKPSSLIVAKVEAGELGRKTKKGFYPY